MRLPPCIALAALLAACGADPVPPAVQPAPMVAADGNSAAGDPVAADPGLAPIVARLLAGTGSPTDIERAAQRPTETVAEMLAVAVNADVATLGRAPAALLLLGTAALPGLAQGLAHREVLQRRLAAQTLLLYSDSLHQQGGKGPVVLALAAARGDQDPAVRAAAIHAYSRATGDTSVLDQSRAAHAAAENAGR